MLSSPARPYAAIMLPMSSREAGMLRSRTAFSSSAAFTCPSAVWSKRRKALRIDLVLRASFSLSAPATRATRASVEPVPSLPVAGRWGPVPPPSPAPTAAYPALPGRLLDAGKAQAASRPLPPEEGLALSGRLLGAGKEPPASRPLPPQEEEGGRSPLAAAAVTGRFHTSAPPCPRGPELPENGRADAGRKTACPLGRLVKAWMNSEKSRPPSPFVSAAANTWSTTDRFWDPGNPSLSTTARKSVVLMRPLRARSKKWYRWRPWLSLKWRSRATTRAFLNAAASDDMPGTAPPTGLWAQGVPQLDLGTISTVPLADPTQPLAVLMVFRAFRTSCGAAVSIPRGGVCRALGGRGFSALLIDVMSTTT
mmetsp:Transcript_50644/g.162091  ORF Transcript_50644/g.162091 Transcript_50644/m.162091 type:complete len:366 (-) Transcript_50644:246-1343(-)